ncbi:HD domain-containing protein [Treponema phagedenis]|uniref:HD domain-containing protein n=1 Tax=Treponema phagedenis TaxID=162 RepID=A0A0B7GQB0_TREPH|nr:HD domain-containing protein [Treponema phagedenis]NVP23385.1 HD domain-containing protein [Treponema phagedenis]QEJ95605.1 HD domain-containing protein [Treponema phagedenis]QEJ98527.1 HD domain-containing protein [Treponema phagedenis]QEK01458.1 HD domain-containing protein [Treponema phagedenis]QEK04034.1 HD domain-containing protein [Treponema phagedenis]
MFNKAIVLKLFEAFSIQRWNDLIRPFDMVEMDKTAEKMFLAYIIGKYEEKSGKVIDWNKIIDNAFFELLRKIALSDIKAPVQRIIRSEYPEEYQKLNLWVFKKYETLFSGTPLLDDFFAYLNEKSDYNDISLRVLRAAHKYSTIREFEMLKMVNEPFRLSKIAPVLEQDIEDFTDLRGMQLLITKRKPYALITEIEKLRFQIRWNQTPRVPETSVLGHSYFVAALTLLMSKTLGRSRHRTYNNFFGALFHDLPEAVTRDIISPVKQATEHLPDIVKDIEDKIVSEELVPLMDAFYRDEVLYYIQDEFENRILKGGKTCIVDYADLESKYAEPKYKAIDGALIRTADQIAAFVEADSSIEYGIKSDHLLEGRNKILQRYPKGTGVNGLAVDLFFNAYRN